MTTAVEFDFARKVERSIPADQAKASCASGLFCWIDLDATADHDGAIRILRDLGVNEHCIEEAVGPDSEGRHDLYEDCLHFAVTSGFLADGHLVPSHVDVVVGENFLITLRRGTVEFIEQVRRGYRQDFLKFAKSSGFLLYEFWDYLIENYKRTLRQFESQVEEVQTEIFGDMNDVIFNRVAAVTRNLLAFRKIMLASREVLHELSSRRSAFVSESTQPFLTKLAGTLERLCADLAVEREILSETLNLYMGLVGHRTNRVVSRLTVLSMIFLPLTFLCGVYGMNFDTEMMMPELTWRHGYKAFWTVAILIAGTFIVLMRRGKWI